MLKNKQLKLLLLVVFLLVSPALWLVLGNIPYDFRNDSSWFYVMTFAILAFAIYLAFDTKKK